MPTQRKLEKVLQPSLEQRARARRVCSQEGEASQQMADPEEGTGQMKAKIVVEDMLNNLPREMKVWMEWQPTTSVEVAQLIQAYRTAREKPERGDGWPNVASDSREHGPV